MDREGSLVLVSDFDRDRRWFRSFVFDADHGTAAPRLLWDMSADEKYKDPGSTVYRVLPTGAMAVMQHDGCIYLDGGGSSPKEIGHSLTD
jgi:hypothetical protein